MNDRILVAFDGSERAAQALEYAFETFPEASLTAVYVIEVPGGNLALFEGPELRPPVTENAREYADGVLEEATAVADEYGRDLETDVLTGKPERRIVEYAADGGYDSIVVGSHGRAGVSRILLGSVAEDVVRRAPIPVVVVR